MIDVPASYLDKVKVPDLSLVGVSWFRTKLADGMLTASLVKKLRLRSDNGTVKNPALLLEGLQVSQYFYEVDLNGTWLMVRPLLDQLVNGTHDTQLR